MEHIKRKEAIKKYQKYYVCQNILAHIYAQIEAISWSNNKQVQYNFPTLNKLGCPLLKHKRSVKIQKYVIEKLTNEGFCVHVVNNLSNGIEWSIIIQW
jgi:hypothetical protein